MSNRKLRSALRAADRGCLLFPLHGIKEGKCTCGNLYCPSPGKHPRTTHGFKDATRDAVQICDWWKRWPTANPGIATGAASGLVVLDVDPRHGGVESLNKLEQDYGKLPAGPCVRTGGGGEHRLFSHPGYAVTSKIGLRLGIDFLGDGGYVVGVGGQHSSGSRYVWAHEKKPSDIALPPLPLWLLGLLGEKRTTATDCEASIPEGMRNVTLASLGGAMRRRGATVHAIEAALLLENALRCDSPLPETEVEAIARSIARYSPYDTKILSSASGNKEAKESKRLKFRTAAELAKETPAAVPWVFEPLVAFGAITELAGKVKQAGKSTFITHLIAKILTGSPFLDQPTVKSSAIYLTEQPPVSFRSTLQKAGLLGHSDLSILFWGDAIGAEWASVVQDAVAECRRRKAGVLVIDTLPQFANLVGDSENSAGDALKAIQPLQQAAAEGIAVIIVRHERKSGGALGDSGRGSSAFAGAVDILMSIRHPEGNHPANVRLLQSISRFGAANDLLVQLTDQGYTALGSPGEAATELALADLIAAIPELRERAVRIQTLEQKTGKKRANLQRLLDLLLESRRVLRIGKGTKGHPYRFFRA